MSRITHPFPAADWKTIHLKGVDREIGRQHAEAVGEACRIGMPKFYHDLLHRMLHRRAPKWKDRLVLGLTKALIDPVLVNRILRGVPVGFRERIAGMAEAGGLSARELNIALVLPDLGPIVQTALSRAFPARFVDGVSTVRFGCSSFVARGDRFLVGRNLDFPGVAYWDRYPIIQSLTPHNGLRSISFTTAGVPIGGITGINEAQIFVAIHQHYCRQASLSGNLPFILGERILSEARTLEDAVAILNQAKLSSSWAYVLADGKTRDAAIWEGTPKVKGLHRLSGSNDVLAHSNYFQTTACAPTEYATSARMNWDNYYRKSRLEALVREAGGALTPEMAARALSDHFDAYWGEEKVSNRTVSQSYNIQSVVVDPVNMVAWLATGNAPIHLREFRQYDLGAIFDGGEGRTEHVFPAFRFSNPEQAQAKEAFILSFVHAMDGQDEEALNWVGRSIGFHLSPEVALTGALVAMKEGEFAQAEQWLQSAAEWVQSRCEKTGQRPPPESFEIRLFQGRVADLLGKRARAQALYDAVATSPDLEDANLRRVATQQRPYRKQDLSKMLLPYSSYVPFS